MSQRHQREDDYMPTSFTRKIPFHSVRLAANNSYISSVSHFNDSRPRVSLSRFHQEDAVLQAVTLKCNTNNEQLSHPRIGLRSVRTLPQPLIPGSSTATTIAYGDWTQGLHCLLLTVILTDPCGRTHIPNNVTHPTSLSPALLLGGFEYFHAMDGATNHFIQRSWPDLWANEVVRIDSGGFRAKRDVAFMDLGGGCTDNQMQGKMWHVELAFGYERSTNIGVVEYTGEIVLLFQRKGISYRIAGMTSPTTPARTRRPDRATKRQHK